MEDSDGPSVINFDVVPFGSKHWCVVVDGSRSAVPFISRDSAAAAARAQARQFNLHSGLPTRVRVADVLGSLKCKNCYNEPDNILNDLPFEARRAVSHPEMLASDTRLENHGVDRHKDCVTPPRADMETSDSAHRPPALS